MWQLYAKDSYHRKEIELLAEDLGTVIPYDIDEILWAVPILQRFYEKIRILEEKVVELEGRNVQR